MCERSSEATGATACEWGRREGSVALAGRAGAPLAPGTTRTGALTLLDAAGGEGSPTVGCGARALGKRFESPGADADAARAGLWCARRSNVEPSQYEVAMHRAASSANRTKRWRVGA